MNTKLTFWLVCLLSLLCSPAWSETDTRLTVLYDAFGKPSALTKDWGFSLLIEHDGKQFLFDTGNNAEIFGHNVETSQLDLDKLEFAIVSHRHGDHMGGLPYLLKQRPDLTIYAPAEGFGVFGAKLPGDFYPANPALPSEMRYFDGHPPEQLEFGTAWPEGHFDLIKQSTEITPGIHLIALTGDWGTDLALRELSLAIDTPKGLILVVGCSHPTIEKIVASAQQQLGKPVHLVIGGTHLLPAPRAEIHRIADNLHADLAVNWVAPAHCTGEPAFEILRETFKDRYLYAGLGSTITVNNDGSVHSSESNAPLSQLTNDDLMYRLLGAASLLDEHQH